MFPDYYLILGSLFRPILINLLNNNNSNENINEKQKWSSQFLTALFVAIKCLLSEHSDDYNIKYEPSIVSPFKD